MEHYSAEAPINAGTGQELSILALAQLISGIIGWEGRFLRDATKPDGMPRKLLDATRLNEMGWSPRVTLADGIRQPMTGSSTSALSTGPHPEKDGRVSRSQNRPATPLQSRPGTPN